MFSIENNFGSKFYVTFNFDKRTPTR